MKGNEIVTCYSYSFSVDSLIKTFEELIENTLTGDQDLIEKDLISSMKAIRKVREKEKEFQKLLENMKCE